MKKCHVCEARVSKKEEFCPNCGAPLHYRKRQLIWLTSIFVVVAIVGGLAFYHTKMVKITSPEAVVDPFYEAIETKDLRMIRTLMNNDKWSDAELYQWVEALHTSDLEVLHEEMISAATRAIETNEAKTVWNERGEEVFRMHPYARNVLYPSVKIEILSLNSEKIEENE